MRGPFYTQLGILKPQADLPGEFSINALLSQALTVTKGAVITGINQTALIADGGITEVTIQGVGLENVDDVVFIPPDGISISSLIVAPDGTQVTFTVTVDPGVEIGTRQIILYQQGNQILTTNLTPAQITIAAGPPEVTTIEPIVVTRLSEHTLTVNGRNFESAHTLSITPAEDIIMASPFTINEQGTQITAKIIIGELAELGDRVVSVTGDAGSSSQNPSPENTLTSSMALVKKLAR